MEKIDFKREFLPVVKGTGLAVIITLIGVLLLAVFVRVFLLSSQTIKIINQFIKTLAVFFGCFKFLRESKGLIRGAILGAFSAVIIRLLFSLLGGEPFFCSGLIIDLLFCGILGGIFGVITVNVKNKV